LRRYPPTLVSIEMRLVGTLRLLNTPIVDL
jgi:hypothetical protein